MINLGSGATYQGPAGFWANSNYIAASGSVNVVANAAAKFRITGVQIEQGLAATPFERRSHATELQLCQRYFIALPNMLVQCPAISTITVPVSFPTTMRSAPAIAFANIVYSSAAGLSAQSPNTNNFGAQIGATVASGYCTFTATANAEL
jgi:hypothetical protein